MNIYAIIQFIKYSKKVILKDETLIKNLQNHFTLIKLKNITYHKVKLYEQK